MELTDVRYEVENGLAWITIDRQDRLNAFRAKTVDELIRCFKAAWADRDVPATSRTKRSSQLKRRDVRLS